MLPGPSDTTGTRVRRRTLAPRDASCPYLRRESQSGTPRSRENTLGSHTKRGLSLADTINVGQEGRVPRRAGVRPAVAILTTGPRPRGIPGGYEAAPAAFAASRTAPATAPATFSLKTLGMM
ncbi:hypothetical protein GCM10022232_44700 [Streptomyces plumbiresistens]|uniref:Uncharacterized protein n=1 Tax=Streptomyces plumbiresistens TaxID=511811 RepID=A0ABP7RSR4_9ACTN